MQSLQFMSPLGLTTISGDIAGVSAISCTNHPETQPDNETSLAEPLLTAKTQLQAYFAGTRQTFDFLINPTGTDFQQRVWQALLLVPFGTTTSYMTLTKRLGDEKAIRAVAAANGRNPLWIVPGRRYGSLPSYHRLRRLADRLCRGTVAQKMAYRTRKENHAVVVVLA
jgi:methylated-DNA-[protein]-cysteine S-methyltransferase